jgi:hypothetical protein
MSVYRSTNEPWNPGIRPDADEAAAVLIGRENVQRLRLAGIQLESHFWEETRNAVIAAGGAVVPKERRPYWSEADYAQMFGGASTPTPRASEKTGDGQS